MRLTKAMKQAHYIDSSPYIDSPAEPPPTPDAVQDSASLRSAFLNWLAYFTVYLGVVAVVCAIGFYFLWQLPIPQEWSQLLKGSGHASAAKPLSGAAPANTVVKAPANPVQSLANPPATQAANTPETVVAAAAPNGVAETDSDPNAPPLVVETPAPDSASAAKAPETSPETPALTETPPTPPTPQAEIEQALAEAQQQMSSRRLTAPANGNALRSYQRVLELDPNNAAARAGIEQIAAYYREIAEKSLRQGRPDESLAYVGRGLRATPQNQDLLELRRQARLLQQQREQQAQQEEMRRRQAEQARAERQYQEQVQEQQLREQLQEQLRREQPPPSAQPWWQQPPTYNHGSGFNQR